MSYSIQVEERAAERLRAASPRVKALIVEQIDRLGENVGLGVRIGQGPLKGRMLYSFVIEPNPRVLRVGVLYLFEQDEQTISITDVGILVGNDLRPRLSEGWPSE